MKQIILFFFALSLIITFSCNKDSNSNIKYSTVEEEIILPANLKDLSEDTLNTDTVIDNIISNLVEGQLITSGTLEIDIDNDSVNDLAFEIIDLNNYNQDSLPDMLDSLAVRAIPATIQLIDNSNHNYPDAFDFGDEIGSANNFTAETSVLGTFLGIGNFNNSQEKYLGFRINAEEDDFYYGWIRLKCATNNESLYVFDYAYNTTLNKSIQAGEE